MRQEAARLSGTPPRERPHRTTRRKIRSKRARSKRVGARRASLGLLVTCGLLLAACSGDAPPPSEPTATEPQPAATPDTRPDTPSAASAGAATQEDGSTSPAPAPRTESAPPAPAPPVNVEVLLDRAAQLEHDGYWEAAAEARALALRDASATTLSPTDLGDAFLAQIRLLLRLEQPGRATETLAALDAGPASVPETQRWLIRAHVLAAGGAAESALAAYSGYLSAGGAARHQALLARARLRTALGDIDFALRDYESIRDDPMAPALDLESALLEGGLVLENAGRYAEADEWYRALADVSPWASDDAFALHRSGVVRLEQGDLAGALAAWTQLLTDYPAHWRAAEAYDHLLAAGFNVDPLVAGLHLYRQSRLDDAAAVYEALLDGHPTTEETGIGLYYLAAIEEDLGNRADAIEGYLASVAADPAGPQADNALWWAGRLLEEQDSNTLARIVFARLAAEYPDSEFAADAAFRVPLAHYRAGRLDRAADDFRALTESADPDQAGRAGLWLGKSLDALGDAPGAAAAHAADQGGAPYGYTALRAQAVAAGALEAPWLAPGSISPRDPAGPAPLDAWLDALPGADAATAAAIEESADWRAAVDLWAAGLSRQAESRFRLALNRTANPRGILHAARRFDAMGVVHLRLAAAVNLLERVPAADRPRAPLEILRWAYPRGWPELAAAAARNFGVDELLLYAMIRQESFFNPQAGSIAGALGLTQVIPTTGADIAGWLNDGGFHTALLFRPERSIRYGAAYLGAQLANFGGSASIALAAYNGGPGNAARWSQGAAALDPDLFYEAVDFGETRAYLRLVLENYAWYQYIYRGATAPTLLRPVP